MRALGNSRSGLDHPLVWGCVIAATLTALLIIRQIWWLAFPFIMSIIFYYISTPWVAFFQRRGLSKNSSIWVFLGIVTFLIMLAAPFVVGQIHVVSETAQTQVPRFMGATQEGLDTILHKIQEVVPGLEKLKAAEYIKSQLGEMVPKFDQNVLPGFFDILQTWVPSFLLTPYISFFFLRDGFALKKLVLRGVPNAFFERSLRLFESIDEQLQQYFRGMISLTILDSITLAIGLSILGCVTDTFSIWTSLRLGVICAIFAWVPIVGSIAGCLLVVFVSFVIAPENWTSVLGAVILFLTVRILDDFFYMPITIGRSLSVHPLLTVLIILIGGFLGGVQGMLLAMPVLGIFMVVGEMIGEVMMDPRLRARYKQAQRLRREEANEDLI